MKNFFKYFVVSLSLLALSCDNENDTKQLYKFEVATTVGAGSDNYYNGLSLQFGLAESSVAKAEAKVENGKVVFELENDLSELEGKNVWFGVKGFVKFFHTLTAEEVKSKSLTLPDKDKGSTLKSDDSNTNDWIVALYMGINKDGKEDGAPIYWSTGNLISVKTTEAGEPTEVAFHIATDEETVEESNAQTTMFVGKANLLTEVPDGYVNIPKGRKWDVYCFGDKTGLMLYDGTQCDLFVTDSKQMVGDNIVFDISGNKDFDIATNLGGTWRTPTGGKTGNNEYAALEDSYGEYTALLPDHEAMGTAGTNYSVKYEYTVKIDSKEVSVNTLYFPSAGYRHAKVALGRGSFVGMWTATADPTCTPVFYGNTTTETGEDMPQIEVKPQTAAFAYSSLVKETTWYVHPRTSSMPVRPVTE